MKVLFLHGLASSGAFKTATSLHHLLQPCEVIAPDIPIDPDEAGEMLGELCRKEAPDLIVGLSMGGFWAQKLRGYNKILINPDFHVSKLMRTMKGEVQYLSPRRDGETHFVIDDDICDRYELLEKSQFEALDDDEIGRTEAMFADNDNITNCSKEFASHYPGHSLHYHGGHLPTHPELKSNLPQLVAKLMENIG